MKKLFFSVFLFFVCLSSHAQNDSLSFFKSVEFHPVIGFKVFNPYSSYQPVTKGALYFPLILGIEAYSPKLNLSIDFRQSFFNSLSGRDTNANILYSRKHTTIGLTYHFKRKSSDKRPIRFGIAYASITTKNIFTSYYGFPYKMKGASIFLGVPFQWLDFELRAEPDQEEVLEWDKVSLGLVYHIGPQKFKNKHSQNLLNLLIGAHASLNRNYFNPNKGQDIYSPVMVMPEIGLQYEFSKINLAIEARRNLWLSFTAGDPRYDINGNTEQIFIGLSRNRTLEKQSFTYGLSYVLMRDIGNAPKIPISAPNAVEYYTERGIALTLSYPFRRINIEARGMYAYHINQYLNSPVINQFDKYRISLGAMYIINPLRPKK